MARHKAAKEQRSEVVADLEAAALPAEHQQLLLSTASRGQRATKRQRLRRELMAQRAGIHLPVAPSPLPIPYPYSSRSRRIAHKPFSHTSLTWVMVPFPA